MPPSARSAERATPAAPRGLPYSRERASLSLPSVHTHDLSIFDVEHESDDRIDATHVLTREHVAREDLGPLPRRSDEPHAAHVRDRRARRAHERVAKRGE